MTINTGHSPTDPSPLAGAKVPRHVAIIMDGNGRWASQRGLPRIRGHEEGAESVRATLRGCRQAGVKYLTLYAFSVENWIRPRAEVSGLMNLLTKFLKDQEYELHQNKVRLRSIGNIDDLPMTVRRELNRVIQSTACYTDAHLVLALSYGARTEIVNAVRSIAALVRDGKMNPAHIVEKTVAAAMYLPDVPDPDLIIRTSGEFRVSNFLLWQISYSELYFTKVLWPDFREKQLFTAINEFSNRKRRFGNIKESC